MNITKIIESCEECSFMRYRIDMGADCYANDKCRLEIPKIHGMPTWCPLRTGNIIVRMEHK